MVHWLVVFSIVQKISVTYDFKWRAVFIMLTLCDPEDSISALNHFALNFLLVIFPKDMIVLTYKQQNNIPATVVISFCSDKMGSLWTFVLFVVSIDRVRHLVTTCKHNIRLTFRETWLIDIEVFLLCSFWERLQSKTPNRWIKF